MSKGEQFSRNELYWGEDFQKKLGETSVAVFGLGGVGGFALEALLRAGIGKFTLVDFAQVSPSNLNRQVIALNSTVGMLKTDAWKKRIYDINPDIELKIYQDFYNESLNEQIFSQNFDYVVDAIDTLGSKIGLIKFCYDNKIKIVSSFGAGNRIDCSKLKLVDLSEIKSKCTFVKNVVAKLKKIGIQEGFPVVISEELPKSLKKVESVERIERKNGEIIEFRKFIPASISTVPAVCGYLMANRILMDLLNEKT